MRERLEQSECPDMEICPRCHRRRVVQLRSMARHSELDWFKCDGCEHVFTRKPAANERASTEAAAS
jgi:hypothetical protein